MSMSEAAVANARYCNPDHKRRAWQQGDARA